MNQITINQLKALNSDFYQKFAPEFSATRQNKWPGWENLWQYFLTKNFMPFNIIDVGCGNGRFVAFLQSKTREPFRYLGIDNNAYLIEQANQNFSSTNIEFKNIDILTDLAGNKKFDLIVAFGVMHHIPSNELRLEFLSNLKKCLTDHGKIVFTCWNFTSLNLFNSRLELHEIANLQINPAELGQNDYLLRWANSATNFRYCHNYTPAEIEQLLTDSSLKFEHSFHADGKDSKTNTYYVITK